MQKVLCRSCGSNVGVDDFAAMCCPVCDSFMMLTKLDKRVNPELLKVIRFDSSKPVERVA